MINILIVEDDLNISKLIKDTLLIAGYNPESVYDGQEALDIILNHKFDLIILDVMLPKLDGFEIMNRIENIGIPVIFLSAKKDLSSIVKGLKLGSQDYMTKPFEPLELLARIEVILKRVNKEKKEYAFNNIIVNIETHTVHIDDKAIDLTPKEFDLLVLLMKNINIVLTRDKILEDIWGIAVDIETRTVDYHIQQLRKKLGLKDKIVTINKIGYRLEN